MWSASCEVIGRSSQVYIVGDGRCCPSKSIKFNQVPTISCHESKNHSNSSVSVPARRVNGATTNTTAKFPDGYRRSVGICLVKPSKMVFMGSRNKSTRFFQMPQGGANEGEDLRSAAMRELQEETGVTSAEFLAEAPYWMSYYFPPHSRYLLNRRWGTNYKGQAQKWQWITRSKTMEQLWSSLSHISRKNMVMQLNCRNRYTVKVLTVLLRD